MQQSKPQAAALKLRGLALAASDSLRGISGKLGDLKLPPCCLLLALIVYRIGAHVPVPGIDPVALKDLFESQQGGILGMFNMFSGGALSRFSIFALGIMPYISASIIMQLGTVAFPDLEALKKEGESGRRKITQIHAVWDAGIGACAGLWHIHCIAGSGGLVIEPGPMFLFDAPSLRW